MNVMNVLAWLADAPLFIDDDQVSRFHDAVLEPNSKEGTTKITLDQESMKKLQGKMGGSAEVSPSGLGLLLSSLFHFKASANAEVGRETHETTGQSLIVELHPIETPQRQLVQVATHYLANYGDRLMIVDDLSIDDWRQSDNILLPPRALAFIDVPKETQILPMAAEFANGEVVLFFDSFTDEGGKSQPEYPKRPQPEDRQKRWRWFAENVSPTQGMAAIEKAAIGKGRVQWIDYRVMLDELGNTLHLHVVPAGRYDAGTFAYNFVKRGNRHGLRLVGTLKSGPGINILAVYEK